MTTQAPSSAFADSKFYVVPMFPYPSGRLHMGHARNYAIADAYARNARALGRPTMFPIGWDSFGLPAEKAAQQSGADPKEWTESNIESMRAQLGTMDFSFDWSRELATHKPEYYQHTQAIFVALMKGGLVYKKPAEVWWDPVDHTVLANEQVVNGRGWRSGATAERRSMSMYWIATSKYGREMAAEPLAWSSGAKADHLAWIGVDEESGAMRLRDWCVSRQRAWGTPVPAIECSECGPSPMAPSMLPHPHAEMGKPCPCPQCGGAALKSAETLDTFVDSSWYYLRYPEQGEPGSAQAPIGANATRWAPVDLYVGGREHATMHLLYARFMSRALADCGWDIPREPFARYVAQGMVKARAFSAIGPAGKEWVAPSRARKAADGSGCVDESGRSLVDEGVLKMSKSALNGVDPSDVAARQGVDAMRLFLFFAAPFEFDMEWDESAVAGCARFAKRFGAQAAQLSAERSSFPASASASPREDDARMDAQQREFNAWAQGQYARFEGLNGVVAGIMKRSAAIQSDQGASIGARIEAYLDTCRVLHPLAPSLAQSLAATLDAQWTPSWDRARLNPPSVKGSIRVVVQFEGKFIEAIEMPSGLGAQGAFEAAMAGSSKFRVRAEEAGSSWESCVWVDGRAINGMAPRSLRPASPKA